MLLTVFLAFHFISSRHTKLIVLEITFPYHTMAPTVERSGGNEWLEIDQWPSDSPKQEEEESER